MKRPIPRRRSEIALFIVCLLASTPILFSCSGNLDRDEYIRWVQDVDNGLHTRKDFLDFTFDLQYQPTEYMLLQRGADRTDGNTADNQSYMQYYTLTISVKENAVDFINYNVSNDLERQQKLYYFSYQFQDDIWLEENGKKLPCVLFHFEKSAGFNNSRTFVLGFETPFEISDGAIFNIHTEHFSSFPVGIKISKKNIPLLAL